jgi:hypothetical protein
MSNFRVRSAVSLRRRRPLGFEEIRAREEEGETETDNNLAGTLLVGRIEPGAFAQFADPWRQCDRGVFWHGQ